MAGFGLADEEDWDSDPLLSFARSLPDREDPLFAPRAPSTPALIPSGGDEPGFFSSVAERAKGITNIGLGDVGRSVAAGAVDMFRAGPLTTLNPLQTVADTAADAGTQLAERVTGNEGLVPDSSFPSSLLPGATAVREQNLKQASDSLRAGMSEGAKAESSKSFVTHDPEAPWYRGYSAGDASLGTVALSASESLPSVAGGAAAGGVARPAITRLANVLGRSAMATAAESGAPLAVARLARLDKLIGAAAAGFGEASIAAPMSGQSVREEVLATPISVLAESPRFQELMQSARDLPEKDRQNYARDVLANELAQSAEGGVFLATLMAGPLGANTAGRAGRAMGLPESVATHTVRGRVGEAIVGGGEEALQETLQSGAQGAIEAREVQQANPSIDIAARAANEAVGGGVAGGLLGAGLGATTGGERGGRPAPVRPSTPESAPAQAGAVESTPAEVQHTAAPDSGPVTPAAAETSPSAPELTSGQTPTQPDESPGTFQEAVQAARAAGADMASVRAISQATIRREITPADAIAQVIELTREAKEQQPTQPETAPADEGVVAPTAATSVPKEVASAPIETGPAVRPEISRAPAVDAGGNEAPESDPFARAEATPNAPIARKRNLKTPDASADSALEFLSKSGGINRGEAESEGFDPADMRQHRLGIRHTFNAKGMSLESAGEALAQAGYPVTDETGAVDKNKVIDLIDRELRGQKAYSVNRAQSEFDQEAEEHAAIHAEMTAADSEAAPGSIPYAQQDEVSREFTALRHRAEAAGATEEELEHALDAQDDVEAERRLRALIDRGSNRVTEPEPQALVTVPVGPDAQPGAGKRSSVESASGEEGHRTGAAGQTLELTQQAAPREPTRAPTPQPQDLFGAAPAAQQAIADAVRAKDAKRNSGQESVETGDRSDLFSQARRQADLDDVTGKAARASVAGKDVTVNTEPTEGQREAGNYAKGHVHLHGLNISIENPRGSTRRGKGAGGREWTAKLAADYGYIRGTTGKDGDHVDVYLGPHAREDGPVHVIDQQKADGGFDEHKVLMGFDTRDEALQAYRESFDDPAHADLIRGPVTTFPSTAAFRDWLERGSQHKPVADSRFAMGNAVESSVELREDQATYEQPDRQTAEDAAREGSGSRRAAAVGEGRQLSLFSNAARPAPATIAARLLNRTQQVETGRFRSSLTHIRSWQDAAQLIAPLRKSPQENLLAVVLDSQERPIAVLRHTVGTADAAQIDPAVVAGSVLRVPGASKVYFAHNHPSGNLLPSSADYNSTADLAKLFEGTPVQPVGMLIVAPSRTKATFFTPNGATSTEQITPATRRGEGAPQLERRFKRVATQKERVRINTEAGLVQAIKQSGEESGVLLMDHSLNLIGILPMRQDEMTKLRTDSAEVGAARVLKAIDESNATGVVPFGPREGAVNVARFLRRSGIRPPAVLVVDADGKWSGIPSDFIGGNHFLSRGSRASESEPAAVREWLQEAVSAVSGVADVHIVDDVGALRAELGTEVPGDVQGVYVAGGRSVYLVADQLGSREQAERKFVHEVFGHLAMERYADMQKAIAMVHRLHELKGRTITGLWNEVARTQPGLSSDTHAKEVIALMAERGVSNSIVDRLISSAKDLLRKMGVSLEYSDAELRQLVANAARALREDAKRLSPADDALAHRAAVAYSKGDDEALGAALNAMSIAREPFVNSLPEEIRTDEGPSIDDQLAEQLVGPPQDGELLFARGPAESDEVAALRRRVMANAAHENLQLKERLRLVAQRITGLSGLSIRQGIIDSFAAIGAYEKLVNSGKLLDASRSPYKQTIATQNLPSVMTAILHTGIPEWKDGAYVRAGDDRKGILEIFSPLANHNDGNLLPQWELYAAARRASRLITEQNADGTAREKLFSQKDIDLAMQLGEQYPEFGQVFDDWQTFNKQTLDMAQEAGLIDPEARAVWESNDYVPFYRAVEAVSGRVNAVSLKKAVANQRAKIKTLHGSDAALSDVFESMLMNTAHLVDASFKNRAAQAIVTMFDGVATERVQLDAQPIDVQVSQVRRAMEAAGIPLRAKLTPEQNAQWMTFFRMQKPAGDNIVTVMFEGKPRYYEVLDPLLYQSMTQMSPNETLRWLDLLGFTAAKRLLTRMATATPDFIVRNWVRDTQSAWVQNHVGLKPFISAAQGFATYLKDKPLVRDLMLAGAGGDAVYDNQPRNIKKILLREMKDEAAKGILDTVVSPRRMWKAYTALQQASENANRIATYKAARAQGLSHAEAAYQAHDVLNFQQRGAWTGMQFAIRVIPFLNARLQGLDRLARGYKENRRAFMLKGLMLTAVTLLFMAAGDDDPRYQELEEYDRDTYWHFWTGSVHWRVPKGFEVGALFGTLPERAIRLLRDQDQGRATWEAIGRLLLNTFSFNPIPQLMKPAIEDAANYDFFTGRPIVGEFDKQKIPEMQSKAWTSPTLIELAKAMPDGFPDTLRSPMRLEHWLRGYTAGIGAGYILPMADRLTRAIGGYPDAPARPWYESPVGARFAETGSPRNTKWTAELYRMQESADGAAKAVKDYMAAGQYDRAREIAKDRGEQLAARPKINSLIKRMRELNQTSRMIQQSRMSAEQKEAALDKLNAQRNDVARQVAPFAEAF